jgi:hypothetical protein
MLGKKSGDAPDFLFNIDSIRAGVVVGWIQDKGRPERQPVVVLLVNGQPFGDVANLCRPDLQQAGKAVPHCGFAIHFGMLEFDSIALFADDQCLFSEHAPPAQPPVLAPVLDGVSLSAWEPIASTRAPRAIFLFADSTWHPRLHRHQQLALALEGAGWDVVFIERCHRSGPGIRVERVEGRRIFLLNLPMLPATPGSDQVGPDAGHCAHWRSLLLPLAREYGIALGIWCTPYWTGLMQCCDMFDRRIFDYYRDFCRPAPDPISEASLQQALLVADAVTFTSRRLPAMPALQGLPSLHLRNGYAESIRQLTFGPGDRNMLFGCATTLERQDGSRWLRDFLLKHAGLPAIVAGSGTLQPMFEHLAQTQANVRYVGEVPHMVAAYCLARSRFGLLPAPDEATARWINPIGAYECLALGLPMLGPYRLDIEEELQDCFTVVPTAPLSPDLLMQCQRRFDDVQGDLDLARYSWTARCAELIAFIGDFPGRAR